jgi:LemA protein
MANSTDTLQAYINKMLQLQNEQRDKPLTSAELKQIAMDIGMSEEDWQASQDAFQGYLKSGQGHIVYGNWKDAVQELEQATALNPNSLEATFGLANAYKGLWLETKEVNYQTQAEIYAERALQIQPGHQATLRVLSELREGEKLIKQNKSRLTLILGGIAAAIVLILFITYTTLSNALVAKKELVSQKWAQVENVYQRRTDLIPQLVKTVKSRAKFEESYLEHLEKVYQNVKQSSVDAQKLSDTELETFQKNQQDLSQALANLNDNLSTDQNFAASQAYQDLQAQIEGSENRISVERKRFNDVVAEYNSLAQKFPYSMLGYDEISYFKMQKGADKTPDIDLK